MRRRLARNGHTSAARGFEDEPNVRNGGKAKDELREILLRRLRGVEGGDSPQQNRSASRQSRDRSPGNHTAVAGENAIVADIVGESQSQGRWDEKLKSLQLEKSQLEKALLERDAELAALRQKETSLTSGCDK